MKAGNHHQVGNDCTLYPYTFICKKGYSRLNMWKLPPPEIHLNVCQMVACDQKLVYAKLQPPKSHINDVRENKEFFFFRPLLFLNSKKNSLKIHGNFTHDTRMQCDLDILALKLVFCVEKKNFNSIFLSNKLQDCPKFFLLNAAFGGRYHIFLL